MIASLVFAIVSRESVALGAFAVSAAIFSFNQFLERKRFDQAADLRADIEKLKNSIETMKLSNGFKR